MDDIRNASLSWRRFAFLVVLLSLPFAGLMALMRDSEERSVLLGLAFGWLWMLVYAFHRWRTLRKRFAADGEAMVEAIKHDPMDYTTKALRDGARWVLAAAAVMVVFAVMMGLRSR